MDKPLNIKISEQPRTFSWALKMLLEGYSVKRSAWDKTNTAPESPYLTIIDDKLMIWKPEDQLLHPLTVHTSDIHATDWVIIAMPTRH